MEAFIPKHTDSWETPAEASLSHQLLLRAGLVRKLTGKLSAGAVALSGSGGALHKSRDDCAGGIWIKRRAAQVLPFALPLSAK